MRPEAAGPTLRPVAVTDRRFLRDLSRRVFDRFGRYDRMIPEWLDGPGVWGYVAEDAGRPAGFALVSLTRLPAGTVLAGPPPPDPGRLLALDLMAIAVEPALQRRGLGRCLLEAVLGEARHLAAKTALPVRGVSLTVATDNHPARRLFEAAGFRPLDWRGETYPRGQDALRMVRPLD